MDRPFSGRSILIAEDEPLIALDITLAFEEQGARVIVARTLKDALLGIEVPGLSAAILDHALGDTDSSTVCHRMKELGIPFVLYSGYNDIPGACAEGVHVKKPAAASELVAIVSAMIPAT
jgi:DNA-binding response OmpR family regulator